MQHLLSSKASNLYLRVYGPLPCRHEKETRCLPVCVVKRLQLLQRVIGCRASTLLAVRRYGSQSCSKDVSGQQHWSRRRSLTRGSRLLAFLSCASPNLFASVCFMK